VTKIERPGSGDLGRTVGLRAASSDGTTFLSLNRNKRSITLDLTTDEGRRIARELAIRADVLVQDLQPGTLEQWGLGPAELQRAAPRLIYCSISAFGEDGPYASLAGVDPLVQATGGMMALTGAVEGPPLMVGAPIADYAGAMNAFQGVLLALFARERTGRGQVVRVDLLSAAIAALRPREWDYFATGEPPPRMGTAHRQLAPY
jgi:crotonobetainyl-CoA:carnitine CoA-transferase CaiB-like acyl-CoA transferase